MATRKTRRSTQIKSAKAELKASAKDLRSAYRDLQKQINAERKEYRKHVAILKRHGLAYSNVDIRSIEPTKYGKRLLRDLADTGIFEGNARVQKVSKDEARILQERMLPVRHGRVILPANEETNQRLVKVKGKKVRELEIYEHGELVNSPLVGYEDWDEYLDTLREQWEDFESNGHQLAFRFYGHLSRRTFGSIDKAIDYLSAYKGALGVDINELSANDMNDAIQHIEIIKTTIPQWTKENKAREEKSAKRRKKARPYKARIERIHSSGGEDAVYAFRVGEAAARKKRRKRK